MRGRYFYDAELRGFNFQRSKGRLGEALDFLLRAIDDPEAPAFYVGATPHPGDAPGLRRRQSDGAVPRRRPRSRAPGSAIARRSRRISMSRTISPWSSRGGGASRCFRPSSSPIFISARSTTQWRASRRASSRSTTPDLDRFPRFAAAMAASMSAELEPGDAIFVPSLWWHQVEALAPFNMLMNYWIDPPADAGSPFDAMVHGILAIAALPPARRAAWRSFFDHYVFQPERHPRRASRARAARHPRRADPGAARAHPPIPAARSHAPLKPLAERRTSDYRRGKGCLRTGTAHQMPPGTMPRSPRETRMRHACRNSRGSLPGPVRPAARIRFRNAVLA